MASLFESPGKTGKEPKPDRREALRRRNLADSKRPRGSLVANRGPALGSSPGVAATLVAKPGGVG